MIEKEIEKWIMEVIAKPNKIFGNLPPCPYAKKAWLDGKVKVIEDSFTFDYDKLKSGELDLIIIVQDGASIDELYDLKYKKLTERKSSFNNAEKDLFVKILTGDKSDNIKGVFKKCGPKTACKYFDNKELFQQKLENIEGAMERYLLNKKIIDFNEIPQSLINEFLEQVTF